MYHYHTIFSEVKDVLSTRLNIFDEETNHLYLNIIKNLKPGNDYTFQQIMLEYLTTFQNKSLFFYHKHHYHHNGFYVRKIEDALIVNDVNFDNRLVVGDVITHMSQDEITKLEQRYQKLLFNEADIVQDWTHIVMKQSDINVLRGEESYVFQLHQYQALPENTVSDFGDYRVVRIYDFNQFIQYQTDVPVILDLRYARGVKAYDYYADVILVSPLTKGSPEYFVHQSECKTIGEPTFGAANQFTVETYDDFVFVYGEEEGFQIMPDIRLSDTLMHDEILNEAKQWIGVNR
ncbi:hypothetical protein [Macrococcoides caseolyticum]|uniref:hypothetical protein n=1 Tax=Macrococcoides caseolyticum TaxID=69966 RepID=UPI001F41A3A4|nr:hypothetical protein [Macrococcus caseolyticus]MCE4956796.1 hypothetical protein [Macrococcus caseolyticus]